MQKILFTIEAFTGVLCISLFLILSPLDAQVARNGYTLERGVEGSEVTGGQLQSTSCAAPGITDVERCQHLEAEILDVTLRLEITVKTLNDNGSDAPTYVSVGHATVMGGRFLITHNHFALSPDERHVNQLLTLSAYRADGSLAIRQAPSHTFQVFAGGRQTLIFDFGQYGGQDAFHYMGIASARLATWQALGLRPGMEVAQVNWDGQKTYVDWIQLSSISLENGMPVLQLDNYVEPGASGGGVFYAGYHVGNNWFRDIDKQYITGKILRKWTVAALNDTSLLALATGDAEPALTGVAPLPNGGSLQNLATVDAVVR